ncbi:sugar porter family MFS transporter [Orrella marina]|uniref:MFS transporter n=1 Tax=Orrella marina TaxID=2163011 RepID=A0A2R4XHA4_9BURK|nr:sugar porter family MFS transporter [Orrella marina]AWB33180.1 MFS transporter [Orrella marina]
MIYVVAIIAAIAGVLFGFDEGVIAGALAALRSEFGISAFEEGFMTSAVPLGALFGALLAGMLAEQYGRRATLLLASVLFTLGAVLAGLSSGVWSLTMCRLLLGLAVGLAATVAPLFISENAPSDKRGLLVSIYQLAVTIGILSAYLVNYALDDQWRLMFMLGALPGLALLFGMMRQSDTPRWLMSQGREQQARQTLARLRKRAPDDPAIGQELLEMTDALSHHQDQARWKDLLDRRLRPALVVGIGLFVLQQFSGINAVIYYAPSVFTEAGFSSDSTPILASLGVGVVNVLMTLVGMYLIDRIGRRRLLYLGFLGTAIGLGMIALGAATGSAYLDVLAVAGLIIYIGSFAASIGPLPWVMMSEIYPLRGRSLAMSLTTISNWLFNFLVVFSFPVLIASAGLGTVFGLYALTCLVGLYFTWQYVPETNGVSLEHIERHLYSGIPFAQLRPPPVIEVETSQPDISYDTALLMVGSLIALSPYRTGLAGIQERIAVVAFDNRQIRTALREVHARAGVSRISRLTRNDLGPQRWVLMTFLEHVWFASPEFLRSVGQPPSNDRFDQRSDLDKESS